MKMILVCSTLSMFAAASTASAATHVLDFDVGSGGAIASGTVLTNQYDGVTFSGTENGSPVGAPTATNQFTSEFGGSPVSGNILQNVYGGDRADEILLTFDVAVSGISFDFVPFGSDGPNTIITAFGSGGILAASFIGGPATSDVNFNYTGIAGLTGVTSLLFQQPEDTWVWGLDNFTYTTPVPLPAALPLLLAGLGGLSLAARRKKTA